METILFNYTSNEIIKYKGSDLIDSSYFGRWTWQGRVSSGTYRKDGIFM